MTVLWIWLLFHILVFALKVWDTQNFEAGIRAVLRVLQYEFFYISCGLVFVFDLLLRIVTWLAQETNPEPYRTIRPKQQKGVKPKTAQTKIIEPKITEHKITRPAKKSQPPVSRMVSHYDCDGGDVLSRLGAAWFVKYMYFHKIDNNYKDWNLAGCGNKIAAYLKSSQYYKAWLQYILTLSDADLKDPVIDADEMREMATRLLQTFDKDE